MSRHPSFRSLSIGALLALALGACATVTPYQPLREGLGYSQQQIEPNRYRISFSASTRTPRQSVDDYLLYRAAELTLQTGHDYFVMLGKTLQIPGGRGSGVTLGVGGYGGSGGGGIGIGLGTALGGGPPWQAYADIVLYRGAKPVADAAAYDARAVKASLDAQILRPPPPE